MLDDLSPSLKHRQAGQARDSLSGRRWAKSGEHGPQPITVGERHKETKHRRQPLLLCWALWAEQRSEGFQDLADNWICRQFTTS